MERRSPRQPHGRVARLDPGDAQAPAWPAALYARRSEQSTWRAGHVIGSTLYRIHGSNEPWSIGQEVSSGCIRLTNEDVVHLYNRVRVGAKVIVRH